ncbi:MAG: CinA family protein [Hyphomicrobiales bacterium]|nr:CinA family protein [Hyphomicrobiales bacterium]
MSNVEKRAAQVAEKLIARREKIAVSESSSGGLVSAALLAVPGASAYYLGGAVVYTARARAALVGIEKADVEGMRSASPPYAQLLARRTRDLLRADWAIAETGAAGPTGNPYGDAAGHTVVAISGPKEAVRVIETGSSDRRANMDAFAIAALELLLEAL